MIRTLAPFSATLGLASLLSISPAAALDLLSPGWSFSPDPPGECPTPGSDYDCYESRTASTITLVGSNSPSGTSLTTFSYTLSDSDGGQSISFDYVFDLDPFSPSARSVAFYQVNSDPRSSFNSLGSGGTGSISPFVLNPGDTLLFGVDQNGDTAFAGTLAITSFTSTPDTAPVPFPLPILGPFAMLAGARSLRRRSHTLQRHRLRQTPPRP